MLVRQFHYAALIGCLVSPGLAAAQTDWMGQINQWSVGFETGTSGPYCRLLWDSQLGKTVEFRSNKDTTLWLISKDGWSIPAGKTTVVTIVDADGRADAPAAFFDAKTLQLWNKDGKTSDSSTKRLIVDAFQGTPDLQLTFAGSEADWIVPISRVQTLYPEFMKCMARLNSNTQQTASADPF